MTNTDVGIPDPEGVPKTSDQLDGGDQEQEASAQEPDEGATADQDSLEEEESDDVTAGGVAGQAGIGNG